jgi:hypothetical protein
MNWLIAANLVGVAYYMVMTTFALIEWCMTRTMTSLSWCWFVTGNVMCVGFLAFVAGFARANNKLTFTDHATRPFYMLTHIVVHLVSGSVLVIMVWLFRDFWLGEQIAMFDSYRWQRTPPPGYETRMENQFRGLMGMIVGGSTAQVYFLLQVRFGGLDSIWQHLMHAKKGGIANIAAQHRIE